MGIEYASIDLIQVRVVHISSENWICRYDPIKHRIHAYILEELNMQARNPIQVRKEEHRTYVDILWELNMQA